MGFGDYFGFGKKQDVSNKTKAKSVEELKTEICKLESQLQELQNQLEEKHTLLNQAPTEQEIAHFLSCKIITPEFASEVRKDKRACQQIVESYPRLIKKLENTLQDKRKLLNQYSQNR